MKRKTEGQLCRNSDRRDEAAEDYGEVEVASPDSGDHEETSSRE